jgi:hypothetical protein
MMSRIGTIGTLFFGLALVGGVSAYAQQHQEHQQQAAQPKPTAAQLEEEAIFCPTMKTGQLCSHGTAANLRLTGEKQEQWVALARKYNRAVDTATEALFKDAEAVLNPEQMALLKAWFAVGLNPEINQILYGKGLGPMKAKE